MLVFICAIFYTLMEDIAGVKAKHAAEPSIARGE